jgi:hypothetical protein
MILLMNNLAQAQIINTSNLYVVLAAMVVISA